MLLTSAMNLAPTSVVATDWSRREFLRGIGFGMFGIGLPELMQGRALANPLTAKLAARPGKARHCIMIFLFGGPSQIDTWDMKPGAAAEYRGEFQPIATAVPGIKVQAIGGKGGAHRIVSARSEFLDSPIHRIRNVQAVAAVQRYPVREVELPSLCARPSDPS